VLRYIGLDLHKEYVHGCEWVPDADPGHKERHFRFPNTSASWSRLIAQLTRDCWVAIEVTGSAFEIHDLLSPHAGRVLLANPVELKRLGSGRHTDRSDALRLAKLLATDAIPAVWVPPVPVREVRRLLHYRARLLTHHHRCIYQARAVLRRHGILIPHGADVGRWATEVPETVPLGDRLIFESALRQVAMLAEELAGLDIHIARVVADVPAVELLLTITGYGLIAAAATWAAIGDPRRFIHPKQLTRYAGLDPSVLQSGEEHYQGRISKNGNSLLRTVLVEAAHTVALHDTGSLRQFYLRKAKQIGHMKAIVALARKLLIVAWRMLLTGETYRAAKPHLVTRKHRHLQKLSTARSGANGDRVLAALVRQYWNPRVREARSRTKAPA